MLFQELNTSNVSPFLIDCQSYFLLVNIMISDIFVISDIILFSYINHNIRIVQKKISAEKFYINNFTFYSFINK